MPEASNNSQPRQPSLARHAAAGAVLIGGSQAARFVLSIATTIVVARILSPDDYGVIAMWAPIFAFVTLFQDFGFSTATVQAKELSSEQSSTLFWVNVIASVVIAILLFTGAQFVGAFYGDPRVASVTAASASIVLIGGLAIQHASIMNREMKFRALAGVAVASALASTIATIALAFYLRSYWALFLGNLASIIVQTILTWTMAAWTPGRRASFKETRGLLGFGTHVAIFNIVNYLSRNADNVLIGKFWGAGPLGLYDRSYKLMMTPLQFINAPLSRVMLPVLSKLRDEPERYRNAYRFSFQALLLATAPGAAIAAAESDKFVVLLLGPNWSAATPIFFWLALVMIYQPAFSSLGWLFISSGRSREYAAWGIFSSVVTVASFVIGLQGGPTGVAKSYFAMNVVVAILLLWGATRRSHVSMVDLIMPMAPLLFAAGISWMLVRSIDNQFSPIVLLVLAIPSSYLIAAAAVWISPHGREFLVELRRIANADR